MDQTLKLALQLFGAAFVFMILVTFMSISIYVLVANLMGW